MLVVRVENEQQVEGLGGNRIDFVRLRRHRKQHVQQILAVRQVIARIDERLTDRLFVGGRGDGR